MGSSATDMGSPTYTPPVGRRLLAVPPPTKGECETCKKLFGPCVMKALMGSPAAGMGSPAAHVPMFPAGTGSHGTPHHDVGSPAAPATDPFMGSPTGFAGPEGDDHDGAHAHEPAKKPEEDKTMEKIMPFIHKCQGEMAPTDECSPAKGFDPATECHTHVEESQKCKSCKAKLLPCVTKALTKAGIKPPKDEGDDHDGAHTHEPAKKPPKDEGDDHDGAHTHEPAKKPENDEGDDHDGAHTWDPLWHEHHEGDDHDGAHTHEPLWPEHDEGDDHDGANAPVPPVVALQDEPAKKPEEDATMKVVAPFIKKCQGEMPATDECSLAKGFDPAKECNTHVEESQKCKSCKAKLLPCVMKAMKKAGIKPPKDDGDDHDGAKALLLIQQGRRGGSLWRSFSLSRRRSRTTGRERRGSTTGRERSTAGRERSTTGRERSTTGRDASRRRSRTT